MVCKIPRPSDQDIEIAVRKIKSQIPLEAHSSRKAADPKIAVCSKMNTRSKRCKNVNSIEKTEENLLRF